MENVQTILLSFLKEATGKSDVASMDFKELTETRKEKIDFSKVRGSVRMMLSKIKTPRDVEVMKREYLALQIP